MHKDENLYRQTERTDAEKYEVDSVEKQFAKHAFSIQQLVATGELPRSPVCKNNIVAVIVTERERERERE